MSDKDPELRAALDALRAGRPSTALDLFKRGVAADAGNTEALLGMAHAYRALGEEQGKIAVIDRLLAVEPRNLRGLIMKADHLAAGGDVRSATSYYLMALKSAPPPDRLSPDLSAELRRVKEICERHAAEYQSFIVTQMAAKGFDPAHSSKRFAQSLDIVLGRKRVYLQEPRSYYFPGLPQIQFYERDEFPWLSQLE